MILIIQLKCKNQPNHLQNYWILNKLLFLIINPYYISNKSSLKSNILIKLLKIYEYIKALEKINGKGTY